MNIDEIVAELRREGGDTARIEAKRASGGFPSSTAETLSAFANTPGGGDIVFGLDESNGFAAVPVYDAVKCQKSVAAVARDGLNPPIAITTETARFEGAEVVIARVPEADRQAKPVFVRRNGQAYLRQYDGDYPLSDFEIQAFIAQRGQPTWDSDPVPDASQSDLDGLAVAGFLAARRSSSRKLYQMPDDEVLMRTRVLTPNGVPTLAGLLAFGTYPQEFFPTFSIQASLLAPGTGLRVLDNAVLAGSIPEMLVDAMHWVARNSRTAIADTAGGRVVNIAEYPEPAVRELVANALIHRDLSPFARSTPVALQLRDSALVVSNPGGLLGVKVGALGHTPSHSRNAVLTEILRTVPLPGAERVVERLGTGIPTVQQALADAGMRPAQFFDHGVRFAARVESRRDEPPRTFSDNEKAVVGALRGGPLTCAQLGDETELTARQIRYALGHLRDAGRVAESKPDGRSLRYHLRRGPAAEPPNFEG